MYSLMQLFSLFLYLNPNHNVDPNGLTLKYSTSSTVSILTEEKLKQDLATLHNTKLKVAEENILKMQNTLMKPH